MDPINPNDPILTRRLEMLAQNALSVESADRERAEQEIREFQNRVDIQSGFVLLLLNVASSQSPAASFCSIVFKNTVKNCWNEGTSEHCVAESDKAFVRNNITGIMFSAPLNVQRNLAEAISMIAETDFPSAWPDALQRIIHVLMNEKSVVLHSAALSTAHSILGRYRNQPDLSQETANDLRVIYTDLTSPLLNSMVLLVDAVEKCGTDAHAACTGLTSAVECLRDITAFDLGDEFIWGIEGFVRVLLRCLQLGGSGVLGACTIELKSVVIMCVSHFLLQFDEDFEKYASEFLKVVWDTISSPSSCESDMDDIVVQGMGLLAAACRGATREVFNNESVLVNLMTEVIMPNLALRQVDVELFGTEPDEYIQRDIEGSDFHTRRREAGELVRALLLFFPEKTGPLFTAKAQELLASAAQGDWKAKDLAIYLVSALSLEGQHVSTQRGVTQCLSKLVPFEPFLKQNVLSELSCGVSPQSPAIVKASCIRFVAAFRAHIERSLLPDIIALLASWILCEDTVVQVYAAHAVERVLTLQDPGKPGHVITDTVLGDKAPSLLHNLCVRLNQEKKPIAYTMQCLMRVCQNCSGCVKSFVGDIITCMVPVIKENSKNPSNPLFSHCMFEVVSQCIMLRPEDAAAIESALWEPMIFILQNDVLEYVPYTLQIMAQLLDAHGSGAPEPPTYYQALLEPLLLPEMYKQRGSIPAIVRLLVSFIEHYPGFVHGKGLTERVIAVVRSLVQYKNYDHEGLNILTTMIRAYPKDVISPYMVSIYQSLIQRLQKSRTPKYVRILIIFLSITVITHGADDVVTQINRIQDGLFWMLFQRVWLPHVPKVLGVLERKTCIIALASLLGDCVTLQQNAETWSTCVVSCLKMIHGAVEKDDWTSFTPQTHSVNDLAQHVADIGYTNAFCPLQGAVQTPVDVCPMVQQPEALFRERLQKALSGPNAEQLVRLLQAYPEVMAQLQ
ncbi:importin-alpha re-exporter protein, putative [Trypanosoma equiperdum]|uniref:Importin-alpha re-exporter protein, putative n=2 Tax=Trypanozoon TaxID=39700 RepID=Q587E0_TRYB2|nr:importin-alpha re-exporter protein, putative [Trypanosoma brucei brucei TREU927]AAX79237.1 importin-alpha re-exporter protein, putative [Trypanosoma brucei]AAZ12032.1 importin-alpha re-exporter protein, putative [Trypanosoma brucei brucei TREU927]SCU66687.1 importin-alpha re-exporter protein, putative [Trypanosoma equiperdum]